MRVVHLIDSGGYYGAEVMLVHLCNAQKKLGLDVEVISIGTPSNYEKPLEAKLRENNIPCKPWRMMALPDLRQSLKILAYCRETGASVIHSHGYKGNILLGLIPKPWRKLPIVSTVHGYTQQRGFSKLAIYQWLDKLCLKRLDAVVLVSEGMRHQVDETSLGNKLHIIPNGIPEEIPDAANEPIPYFQDGDFKIAAIGRLSYEKNFQLLIKSMPLILEKIPNAKLVIFGEGSERESLESLVADLKLEEKVFLPGYIDEPSRVYRHADVFVNCSITEGMPITLLEAMREGCPIVATDISANRLVLFQISNSADLTPIEESGISHGVWKIKSLTRNKPIKEMQNTFSGLYSSRTMANCYLKLYQSVNATELVRQ